MRARFTDGLRRGHLLATVRGGVVVDIKEFSDHGCGDESCSDDGNFVRLDHGDGTLSVYLHLEFNGADVEIDEVVAEGQIIGRTGNTGFSTGPHLHLTYRGSDGFSQPVRFVEFDQVFGNGTPFSGASAISENTLQPEVFVEPSMCNREAFLYRGVQLLSDVPCSVVTTGEVVPIEAQVPEGFDLAVHRFSNVQGDWITACLPAEQGRVSGTFLFGLNNFEERSFLQFSASPAGEHCANYPNWITSPRILVR